MSANELNFSLYVNTGVNNRLSKMAAEIALQNFYHRYATLLFFSSSLCISAEVFLRFFNSNIIINTGQLDLKSTSKTRQHVIFNSGIYNLQQLLETANEMGIDNTGKFIIVCESQTFRDCDEQEAFKLFWKYRIVNVVFIRSESSASVAFTYFPISERTCNNIKPIMLNFSNHKSDIRKTPVPLFAMKITKISSCSLIVSTFIQVPYMNIRNGVPIGADGDLLRLIAYSLNASIKMITPHRGDGWGFRDKNGTWMGSLADVQDDLANFSITSAAITFSRFSDFQISRCYYTVHVVWVTHPATFKNEALKLLNPFGYATRIVLFISYLIVILCALIFNSDKCTVSQNDHPLKSMFFLSWMICMGQVVIKLPTKSALLQAMYFWIYYCFIIRTVYQVYLISSLKGKFYENQFETIEDAIKANYLFGGGPALQDYYVDYPAIYNNWVNVDATEILPTFFKISKGMKFVLAMNWDTVRLLNKKYKVNVHVLQQKIVSSPTGIIFKKYSLLAERINLILSRLSAGGFPEKLHKDYTRIHQVRKNDSVPETLKLVHLTTCYVCLIIGGIFSVVIFLVEIFICKIPTTNKATIIDKTNMRSLERPK